MSKPHFKRSARVGDQMHHEVADILQRKIKDPRIGFLTVTAVEISDDLRNAKVFVSLYGGSREETRKGLESAMPFIRSELGRRMRLKFLPDILFRFDDSADKGARIMNLLRGIDQEQDEGGRADE